MSGVIDVQSKWPQTQLWENQKLKNRTITKKIFLNIKYYRGVVVETIYKKKFLKKYRQLAKKHKVKKDNSLSP